MRASTLKRVPKRDQSAAEQRSAVLATGDAGSVPREIVRVECRDCESVIAPQSVVELDRIRVGWALVAQMATYCPHCQVVIRFNLTIDEGSGKLMTRPVNGLRLLRGQSTIDRFLARYPQMRGVITG